MSNLGLSLTPRNPVTGAASVTLAALSGSLVGGHRAQDRMPGAERRERHASPYHGASQSTSRLLQLFPDSPLAPLAARGESQFAHAAGYDQVDRGRATLAR